MGGRAAEQPGLCINYAKLVSWVTRKLSSSIITIAAVAAV